MCCIFHNNTLTFKYHPLEKSEGGSSKPALRVSKPLNKFIHEFPVPHPIQVATPL